MSTPDNDARLWAGIMGLFRDAGSSSDDADLLARRAVALVRRERSERRTFAPGDEIPHDVTRVRDLDGDTWERQGAPPGTLKDTWKMHGFDPGQHEESAGGAWITPWLLDKYGPLTEMPGRKAAAKGGR